MHLSSLDIFSKDGRGNHVCLPLEDAADHAECPVPTHEEHPDEVAPRERGEVAA
jgi:hypothetical protein